MSHDLQSAAGYTWIGGAFLLGNAASGPIWAKLSDIFGRKLIVLLALGVFFASSAVCATAKTMEALIIGRAFQGTAGGGLILLVHVCISDMFSLRQRSLLMGLTEGMWALAGGIGPVLGGVFASLVDWRWCCEFSDFFSHGSLRSLVETLSLTETLLCIQSERLVLLLTSRIVWINLPISGLAFILILIFLDIKHEHTSFIDGMKAIDWLGIFTFLGCTLMLLLGLDFGGVLFPWGSAKVIALLVVGGCMIFAFIYSEARFAKYPLIPMSLFRNKTNVATFLVVFLHGFVSISS